MHYSFELSDVLGYYVTSDCILSFFIYVFFIYEICALIYEMACINSFYKYYVKNMRYKKLLKLKFIILTSYENKRIKINANAYHKRPW